MEWLDFNHHPWTRDPEGKEWGIQPLQKDSCCAGTRPRHFSLETCQIGQCTKEAFHFLTMQEQVHYHARVDVQVAESFQQEHILFTLMETSSSHGQQQGYRNKYFWNWDPHKKYTYARLNMTSN
ncbi:hypothetical protein BS78_03G032300 [Paspalum vaginatum]|nr:hypothetical protein BS78_03G032300 [Paspalum vaginatum]